MELFFGRGCFLLLKFFDDGDSGFTVFVPSKILGFVGEELGALFGGIVAEVFEVGCVGNEGCLHFMLNKIIVYFCNSSMKKLCFTNKSVIPIKLPHYLSKILFIIQ